MNKLKLTQTMGLSGKKHCFVWKHDAAHEQLGLATVATWIEATRVWSLERQAEKQQQHHSLVSRFVSARVVLVLESGQRKVSSFSGVQKLQSRYKMIERVYIICWMRFWRLCAARIALPFSSFCWAHLTSFRRRNILVPSSVSCDGISPSVDILLYFPVIM